MSKLLDVADVVWHFVKLTGEEEFTYYRILRFYEEYRKPYGLAWIHPNTLERQLRKLAEMGILERWYYKRVAVFRVDTAALFEFLRPKPMEEVKV